VDPSSRLRRTLDDTINLIKFVKDSELLLNIDRIAEQYTDFLNIKIERIEALVSKKIIARKLANQLMSFYIKKELVDDISSICKLEKNKKEKHVFISYKSKQTQYSDI